MPTETAARYDAILEKIGNGVPLAEIIKLQILDEIERADERRSLFREFKETYRRVSTELVSHQRIPTRDEVMNLLHVLESDPLASNNTSKESPLDSLIREFQKPPKSCAQRVH